MSTEQAKDSEIPAAANPETEEQEQEQVAATEPGSEEAAEQSAEQSDEAEQSTEEPEGESEEQGKKRTPWYQTRIDQITREKHEERRQREALEARLAEYESQQARQDDDQDPDIESLVAQRLEQQKREESQRQQSQKYQQALDSTYAKGVKEFQDFDDALGNLGKIGGVPADMAQDVFEFENAHKIFHHLGSNLDEAADLTSRWQSLTPVQRAKELFQLEQRLNKPSPKPVSSAPPPVKPLASTSGHSGDPSKMSMEEWVAWREKQSR